MARIGLVTRAQNSFYYVIDGQERFTCRMRGRLKHGLKSSDLAVAGDRVGFEVTDVGVGVINHVEPRSSVFSRLQPGERRVVEDVMAANVDLVLVATSMTEPMPNAFRVDRFLAIAAFNNLVTRIVLTKHDAGDPHNFGADTHEYQKAGYAVDQTSIKTGHGIAALRDIMRNKTTVILGPSGVGKSSLMNVLYPHLDLKTGEVSTAVAKGKHTTRVAELFLVDEGSTHVLDTPGIRELGVFGLSPAQLAACFIEMQDLHCQFRDCLHSGEKGCGIEPLIAAGGMSQRRYESYRRMLAGPG